ncbi:S-adenosylmethionine:tRNA ribosyltransferase-isomerase [Dyadobacter fanqingshengii]|uniref:S-adenosylmethionine:tRNA ribosyltransferase-isomerase n=1 Tax=Dyadobacter fanqingshengii TaxID=2906443 RepID=A0A9X1PDU6_9BACT|nr:S-adenosylmethionine:tRNA ribosyltransferase-isomerase [Dyadobacter fanqingshengii]MCF0042073.1 S-adenosylmethionine:tRNA ribosyltransferase-isomerase [Dyadobacter fanqingshengii]USJ35390.1 S-adenosylmethionine:tRNA ribosyltransferase-isomerase [Dyadobacter fanqingshengii]
MKEGENESAESVQKDWFKVAESIRLEEFIYDLPDEKVAKYPLEVRDQSKLMIYKDGEIVHKQFTDLPENLPPKTLLIFNDTKVIPARAYFKKETGAVIEILLLHPELPTRVINDAMLIQHSCVWECMIGNKKRWKLADQLTTEIEVNGQQILLSVSYEDYDRNLVRFNWSGDLVFLDIVKALGEIPLPPYLNRDTEARDSETYQTVYAHHDGAVAAPTAGLHFTQDIFEKLEAKEVKRSFLTLHVGAGTFQPIKVSSVTEHRMHSEQVVFTKQLVIDLLENLETIIPVGTTSLRSLESLYWFGVKLFREETSSFFIEKLYPYPFEENELPSAAEALEAILIFMESQDLDHIVGETEIFIFPGYTFRLCKAIITNYHQPGSTLILLVAAFIGQDWKRIYSEALLKDYRFLSYGDSSLLWRKD